MGEDVDSIPLLLPPPPSPPLPHLSRLFLARISLTNRDLATLLFLSNDIARCNDKQASLE